MSAVIQMIWKKTKRIRDALWKFVPWPVWGVVAPFLARTRSLVWYPGWTFGASESEGSFLYLTRMKLWGDYRDKKLPAQFAIRWLEGLKLIVYLGNDSSRCTYVAGNYEPNEFKFMSLVLQPGMVFIDVGANEGLYTLFASKKLGPSGKVISLEPSKREFERLKANLRINQINNVHALRAGAWHTESDGVLKVAGFGHEGHNTLGGFANNTEQESNEKTHLHTLDGLIKSLSLDRVDFIKIDVEGAELSVLRGATELLNRHRPVLQIELFDRALRKQGTTSTELLSHLRSMKYNFYTFSSNGWPVLVESTDLDELNLIAAHETTPLRDFKS